MRVLTISSSISWGTSVRTARRLGCTCLYLLDSGHCMERLGRCRDEWRCWDNEGDGRLCLTEAACLLPFAPSHDRCPPALYSLVLLATLLTDECDWLALVYPIIIPLSSTTHLGNHQPQTLISIHSQCVQAPSGSVKTFQITRSAVYSVFISVANLKASYPSSISSTPESLQTMDS